MAEPKKTSNVLVAHAPGRFSLKPSWMLETAGFAEIATTISVSPLKWRDFWAIYVTISLINESSLQLSGPDLLSCDLQTQSSVLSVVEKYANEYRQVITLNDWLKATDRALNSNVVLLFDGLDTGFGSSDEDRQRRRVAIEGLFEYLIGLGDGFENIKTKIFLREDIWRTLDFQNKSHLFGRTVTLKWSDRPAFYKILLKQAVLSDTFKRLLSHAFGLRFTGPSDVDLWSDQEVYRAWTALVGERMQGGKTAFTRNWVWKRLADSNQNHSPRHLLQLFKAAVESEQHHEKTPYIRSVIRPSALVKCLRNTVSDHALDALREEFAELKPFLAHLRKLGKTPINAADLEGYKSELLGLAREVGLIGIHEGDDDEVIRYKVPDIYRHALELGRHGPQ